jgi:CHAT domain-containing protein
MRAPATAVLAFLLCSLPCGATDATGPAREYLIRAFDGRFDGKTNAFERRVRNLLRSRCVAVEYVAIREKQATADAVELEADLSIVKSERNGPWVASELLPLRIRMVRKENAWAVEAIAFPDQDLADRLLEPDADGSMLRDVEPSRLPGIARAVYERALAMLNAGQFDAAGRAGALVQRLARDAGDPAAEALAAGVLMYVSESTDKERARALSREGVELAEAAGDPDVLARAWYNHARHAAEHVRKNDSTDAGMAESYRRALAFAERAEDPTLLVRVLYSMANAAARTRDHVTARQYVDRILPLAREIADVTGELGAESVLSLIYFEQGDVERGFYHNERARKLAEKKNAYAYISLVLRAGSVLVDERRFDEARAMFARVLRRGPQGELVTTARIPAAHLATTLIAMARMESDEGRPDEGECLLRQAANLLGLAEGSLRSDLAWGHLQRGNYAAALDAALAGLAETNLRDHEKAIALSAAARAYRGIGELRMAASAIGEAIELQEAINMRVAGDERQRAHSEGRTADYYRLAAEIALDLGLREEALIHLERGRARVLRDVLENGRPGVAASSDAAEEDARLAGEQELARLTIELDRARAGGRQASVRQASERLDHARAAHATFLDGLRARSERRALASRPLTGLAEVLERLPDGIVALSYCAGKSQLDVFVARRNAPIAHRRITVDRKVLTMRADDLADALSRRDEAFAGAAAAAYDLLIRPLEKDIEGADGLVVVPDGALWRVPFAALLDRRGRFLIERFPIAYAPSISTYTLMARNPNRPAQQPRTFLGIGNPTLDTAMKTAFVSLYRDADLGTLPDAEREVDRVRELYRQSVVLKGSEASEGRIKQEMPEADIVHFATHALFDDRNPMYSRLALARDQRGHDDGWLEAWEIMLLPLDAELVVLSACDTATGHIGAGEGVVGIAWSFFVAGARATVATQWKVSSRGSAGLMIAFHESLRKRPASPLRKAAALRDAQLQLMSKPRYRHPFYWAAFVVLGDAS